MAQSFDRFAADFDRFAELGSIDVVDWLTAPGVGGERALDVGCGSGRHALILAERFREVVGIDISRPMIEIAEARRSHPRVSYRTTDLMKFHDADGFDFIFSSATLHHISDVEAALSHLESLARPNASLILVDIVEGWPDRQRPTLRRLLYLAGAVSLVPRDTARFGWRNASWLVRFRTGRQWIGHLVSDRFLERAEFERRCRAVFPEASFVKMGFAHAMLWTKPAG